MHSNLYIHRDIKPDNFAVGLGAKSNLIYLFDYGLTKHYKDPKNHKHIPYRDNKALTGTVRYTSLSSHLGIEQSRRDDLESLGYLFVYFLKGSLPWQGLKGKGEQEKQELILEKKVNTPLETLCQGIPSTVPGYQIVEFMKYLQIVRALKFEQKPDYQELRKMFKDLFYRKESHSAVMFDWTHRHVRPILIPFQHHIKRERMSQDSLIPVPADDSPKQGTNPAPAPAQEPQVDQLATACKDKGGVRSWDGADQAQSPKSANKKTKEEEEEGEGEGEEVEEGKDKDSTPRLTNPVTLLQSSHKDMFMDFVEIPNEKTQADVVAPPRFRLSVHQHTKRAVSTNAVLSFHNRLTEHVRDKPKS